MTRCLALVASTVLATASPALALQKPRPCDVAEPRVRCVPYNPAEVVELPAAVGGSLVVELKPTHQIVDVGMSDNGLLQGGDPSVRRYMPVSGGQGAPPSADPNVMVSKRGNFLFIKPLRPLVPQILNLVAHESDGTPRRYTLQLRADPSSMETADIAAVVRFTYPEDEAAVRRARWEAQREAREARAASARLRQHTLGGETVRNAEYHGQGTEADRAALAPSSGSREPSAWDDGHRTYLRYAGNRRIPMVYQVLPDGREGLVGQNTDADPTTNGKLVVLHGVFPALKLRDGKSVLCVVNRGWDGGRGRNPGTGTVSPDVVREATPVREDAPHVR